MSDHKKPEDSGVRIIDLGNRSVYDMREAMSGKYEDSGLKAGDCVIWSDKKIYKVLKNQPGAGATFKKMTEAEIVQLKQEVDEKISAMQDEIDKTWAPKKYKVKDVYIHDLRNMADRKYSDSWFNSGNYIVLTDNSVYRVSKSRESKAAMFRRLSRIELGDLTFKYIQNYDQDFNNFYREIMGIQESPLILLPNSNQEQKK